MRRGSSGSRLICFERDGIDGLYVDGRFRYLDDRAMTTCNEFQRTQFSDLSCTLTLNKHPDTVTGKYSTTQTKHFPPDPLVLNTNRILYPSERENSILPFLPFTSNKLSRFPFSSPPLHLRFPSSLSPLQHQIRNRSRKTSKQVMNSDIPF